MRLSRFKLLVALPTALLLTDCIAYYKPDPMAGLNFARHQGRGVVDASVNRYWATSYFDGQDRTPHTSTTHRPEQKYIREDITLRSTFPLHHFVDVALIMPISHVFQRAGHDSPGEPGAWGVEHFWLGLNFFEAPDRHLSLLFAVGLPITGRVGELDNSAPSHNSAVRVTIQPIVTNGIPMGKLGYYLRLGAIFHGDPGDDRFDAVYEIPGQGLLTFPLGERWLLGPQVDFKYTYADAGSAGADSYDAVGVGPYLAYQTSHGLSIHATYRTEIFGYYASAGSSWNIGFSYGLGGLDGN